MKASTAVSSSSSMSSHKSAAPSPSSHIWPFHLKSLLSSSGMFSPLLAMSSHIHCPTARPQCFTPCIPPVPSLHWFINVCSRTFLSFILKALRLLRNCCLCQVCTARAMQAVENISCSPSASSSEGHRSSCCSIAAPQKQPGYSVAA